MAALYSLLSDEKKEIFLEKMNDLSPDIRISPVCEKQRGISGIRMQVTVLGREEEMSGAEDSALNKYDSSHIKCGQTDFPSVEDNHGDVNVLDQKQHHDHSHSHAHVNVGDVYKRISSGNLSQEVKSDAIAIYKIIAEAESLVHDTDIDQIHFHEVGTLDAYADVAGCALAMNLIDADEIECSPVCLGNGTVQCSHGILPVPAPAVAEITKGMPVYCSEDDGEMLTPTGAAIIKHFAGSYTKKMDMEPQAVGYGFGTRDFGRLTCVRAFLGLRESEKADSEVPGSETPDSKVSGSETPGIVMPGSETPGGEVSDSKAQDGCDTIIQPDIPTEEPEAKAETQIHDEDNEQINPWVDKFLDAEDFEDKYKVVCDMRDDVTDKLIDDIAVIIDVVIPEGKLSDRYQELKNCIGMRQKYENARLR